MVAAFALIVPRAAGGMHMYDEHQSRQALSSDRLSQACRHLSERNNLTPEMDLLALYSKLSTLVLFLDRYANNMLLLLDALLREVLWFWMDGSSICGG